MTGKHLHEFANPYIALMNPTVIPTCVRHLLSIHLPNIHYKTSKH